MSTPSPSKEYQDLYRAGVEAARAKDFERARKLFLAAVTLDEAQKKGWLALARLESDPTQKADYFRHVLRLDPKDAVARAYVDGMQHARPWYRSRWALGLLGLLALSLVVSAALLASRGTDESGQALPTSAQLPSVTPTGEPQAAPSSEPTLESTVTPEATASSETVIAPPLTLIVPNSTQVFLAAPTLPPTPSPAQAAPVIVPTATGIFIVPPTPIVPTIPTSSGVVVTFVTAAPTTAGARTPTNQPLFMEITPPGPTSTGLPLFITPTGEFPGDFNTEVPPPDDPVIEDPNAGGGPRP